MAHINNLKFSLLLTYLAICTSLNAQIADSSVNRNVDSINGFVQRMQDFAKTASRTSSEELLSDKARLEQNRVLDAAVQSMQKAKLYLKKTADTAAARKELDGLVKDYEIAVETIMSDKASPATFRDITTTAKILLELTANGQTLQNSLEQHRKQLNIFRYQFDSLINMPALFIFPKDSARLVRYMQRLLSMQRQIHPVDSALDKASHVVENLLTEVNAAVFRFQASKEDLAGQRETFRNKIFANNYPPVWQPLPQQVHFGNTLKTSAVKAWMTLVFYTANNLGKLIVFFSIVLIAWVYLRSLKKMSSPAHTGEIAPGQLVIRYPFLSALLIVGSMYQFVFFDPPFLFDIGLWTILCVCLTFIFVSYITRYWLYVWLLMSLLFILSSGINLLLEPSVAERVAITILSLVGIISGVAVLWRGNRSVLREKWILFSIAVMVVFECVSFVTGLSGIYDFSKITAVSGYLNVVIAILFLWTVRLINEGLLLAFDVYARQEKKIFYLNPQRVGKQLPAILYALLILGWAILVGRNFPGFDYVTGPVIDFFNSERNLGGYSFSITNLVMFIAIMAVSVIASKIVSFFAADPANRNDRAKSSQSWLLLARITILATGLFLAIAATGIPLDRLTIVLGALGVGIGFGMQTLVNNLVSGLIIAFEKPVNVGDYIDIDGQAGVMKSIGFRSSVILTQEGADMIIPNGDLLNAHLINWSLGGDRKRMALSFSIPFAADIEKIRSMLLPVVESDDRIAKNPKPNVLFEKFSNGLVEVSIYFWPLHIADAQVTKSYLVERITEILKENKISLPSEQHEVILHQPKSGKS